MAATPPPPSCSSVDAPCQSIDGTEHAQQHALPAAGYLPHHSSRYLKESASFALGLNYVQFAELGLKPLEGGGVSDLFINAEYSFQ